MSGKKVLPLCRPGISSPVPSQASPRPRAQSCFPSLSTRCDSQKGHNKSTMMMIYPAVLMSFVAYLPHHLELSLLGKFFMIPRHLDIRSFQQEIHNLKQLIRMFLMGLIWDFHLMLLVLVLVLRWSTPVSMVGVPPDRSGIQ